MSGYKKFMEETEEREQKAWEHVAQARGFVCSYCGVMLSQDEVKAFGTTCSKHQNGWDKSD
jgi:hypothetical protein